MLKKRINFLIVFLMGLLVIMIIIYRFTSYSPPFLDDGKRNVMDRIIDFFSFGWHITKGSIYKDYLINSDMGRKEFGKAGWYRKIYLEKKFNGETANSFSIFNLYKKLDVNSILEKLYIHELEKKARSNVAFIYEAGERFIIYRNWKMAKKAFSMVADSNEGDTMGYYYLGLSYLNLNELDHAKFSFEKVVNLSPDFADAYYRLGLIAKKGKKWIEAKEYFEKALNILPNHLECLKALHEID